MQDVLLKWKRGYENVWIWYEMAYWYEESGCLNC